jgi:hypothetical protein
MRCLPLLLLCLIAACASPNANAPYPAAQDIVDDVAGRYPDVVRLTLHAVPANGTQCLQLASTVPARRGLPSDPEDLTALSSGKIVVLEEPEAVDVTVPILADGGSPTAVAGVTLRARTGSDRAALQKRAQAIADDLAAEVRAAGKPLW